MYLRLHILLIFIFSCWLSSLKGQANTDSLIKILQSNLEDEARVELLLKIHDQLVSAYPDSARIYLDEALLLVETTNNDSLLLQSQYALGRTLFLERRFENAKDQFSEIISQALAIKDSTMAYKASNMLTIVYWRQGDLQSAIEQGLSTLKLQLDESQNARLYNNLGGIFEELDDDEKALGYYEKSLALHRKNKNDFLISGTSGNIGVIYYNLGQYEKALEYLEESIELLRPFNHKFNLSIRLQNIGNVHRKMGNYNLALEYFLEGISLSREINDDYGVSSIASNLSDTYGKINDFTKAIEYANLAESKAREINALQLLVDALYHKAQSAYEVGDSKGAFEWQSEYIQLKDSLLNAEKFRIIQDLEGKYQRVQQANKIQKQEAEIQKRTAQRNLFILGAVLLALVGGLVIFLLRYRLRKNKKIHEQERFIQSQKINDLEKEKKILSLAAMIEGQEAERTRIAKDLHDGLGGLLSTVKAHFSVIQDQIRELEKIQVYSKTTDIIDQAVEEVRRISHNLMPGALRLEGLQSAVTEIGNQLQSVHKLRVELEFNNMDKRLDENQEVFIYRIIQEAVNNIIKHAEASHVLIQLSRFEDEISVVIEDDGKGFDPTATGELKGIGLKSMQSRVEHLGGSFDIKSSEGNGTTISCNIQLK